MSWSYTLSASEDNHERQQQVLARMREFSRTIVEDLGLEGKASIQFNSEGTGPVTIPAEPT